MTIQYRAELTYTFENKLKTDTMSIFTEDYKKAQKVFTAKTKNRLAVDVGTVMYLTLVENPTGKTWKRQIGHIMPNGNSTHWKEVA